MSTQNTNRPVRIPGQPGIYQRGQRYMVRYRAGDKVRSETFDTLKLAQQFKAGLANARHWDIVERVEVSTDAGLLELKAWGADDRPICKLGFGVEAEAALRAALTGHAR